MKYQHIVPAKFLERQNRFIAFVEVEGNRERVHVKNTGRCKELLVPGATVYLEKTTNPNRATAYDLVAVEKGMRMINMDSQAPNKVVEEWLLKKELFPNLVFVRPETTYGNSRFDFYVETTDEKIFIEVKGVTLEEDGVVRFPDAPSDRAVKHVEELIAAKEAGFRAIVLFVIQMKDVVCFAPNADTHEAFAKALNRAYAKGVEIMAYDCDVAPNELIIRDKVEVTFPPIPGEISQIPAPLLAWYDEHKRSLPWRDIPTPYRVWVSEIMLQQTRVEAVKPYFERFMQALPDISALACADEETLLKLWEGLGYYNRVRNLQKAAIQIMEEYGGSMPPSREQLLGLQGIGSYTAGAIASIAFGEAVPAVDGNVLRILSRFRVDKRPITEAKVKISIEEEMLGIMPGKRPGDFNQALMDLGATVCLPNGAPLCEECPLRSLCLAYRNEEQGSFPVKEKKSERRIEEKTVLVIQDGEKAALRKRPSKGLLAGMYEFPSLNGYHTAEEVVEYLKENGITTIKITELAEAKHIFSHIEWRMKGYRVKVDELEKKGCGQDSSEWLYISPEETKDRYPIPTAYEAYTKYLKIKQGKRRFTDEET